MSTIIDLLAVSQEEAVMRDIAQRMAISYDVIHPRFFSFSYTHVDDSRVTVQIRSRAQTVDGEKSPWVNDRAIQFNRATLRGLASQRVMNVNWVSGMAVEHILRALKLTHNFNVSASEIEWQQTDGTWVTFAESYRPQAKTWACRFSKTQARFVPSTSQFSIALAATARLDLGEYLRLIAAGTITGALS